MFFYKVVPGADGKERLEKIGFQEFSSEISNQISSIVRGFIRQEDDAVYARIAAGKAAGLVFGEKAYRMLGLTKAGYCQQVFDRAPKTVDTYVAATESYEDIGGVDCPVQPDSVNQLDVLQTIRPDYRRTVWLASAKSNGGQAPSGAILTEHAIAAKAVIPKGKNKKKGTPDIAAHSCATLLEALSLAEAQCEFHKGKATSRDAVAWTKIRGFLASLPHGATKIPRAAIQKAKKPKRIRDIKGQALMFEEVLKPISHEITEQPEIPQLA